uniref:C2H2-type domain-containing protein n=1 Tax=Glossina palpalis gambiensis TaxID=67801 RepID=A0A1B0BGQ2_9MUSC
MENTFTYLLLTYFVNSLSFRAKNRQDHTTSPIINNGGNEIMYATPSSSGNTFAQQQQQQQSAPGNTGNNNPSSSTTNSAINAGGNSTNNNRKKSHQIQQQQHHQQQTNNGGVQKRYVCTHCPYSTDRRDLYTRHENIHKDEKPFQCYVCLKQFNRADHVKKHFLRMHRDVPYDINKTRRHPPATGHHYRANIIGGGGGNSGGGDTKGNITIITVNNNSNNNNINNSCSSSSNDVKKLITLITNNLQTTGDNVNLEQAFLESQRQPTSSSLSIAETIEAVATATDQPVPQLKQEKTDDDVTLTTAVGGGGVGGGVGTVTVKPKREKRFTCLYCPWSGADKWGLKRHLNTHTKPFVCLLCDYKAARSERLSTHILKVHNKRACSKCNFLGDTLEEYQAHLKEAHPHFVPSQRQNLSTNLNVLRTISNTLGNSNNNNNNNNNHNNNNHLNQFQNDNFSINNSTNANNSVTIYTTNNTNDNQNGATGGPLQEIIVNPTSMGGWRLSATGALIPPQDLLTSGLPNAAVQKRGSERLFQYLEADGSDTEDYSRLIKMDAISRNTSSVAQDFHKAGGVQELKLPAKQQFLFNNKLPITQWTTKDAAALLHSLSSNANNLSLLYQQQQQLQQPRSKYNAITSNVANPNTPLYVNGMRQRQHSTGEDDENTPSSASSSNSGDDLSPLKLEQIKHYEEAFHNANNSNNGSIEQRKAMSAFLGKNFDLQEITYQAVPTTSNSSSTNHYNDLQRRKCLPDYTEFQDQQQHQKHLLYQHEDQENQEQLIRSSPAYKLNNNKSNGYNNQQNKNKMSSSLQQQQQPMRNYINYQQMSSHRLDLHNKENNQNATFLTQLEFQNLNKIGTQFQNYVKDIISKYYAAETPLMFPNMPTPTTTAQQSQSRTLPMEQQTSPKRKRMLSETEEYIEYLKNKEDITLTITPRVSKTSTSPYNNSTHKTPISPLKRERDLASDSYKRCSSRSPKKCNGNNHIYHPYNNNVTTYNNHNNKCCKKSKTQLATLLPLLADAASQQQYLAAPLDFSKKSTANSETSSNSLSAYDKRSSRKQAQPKKIKVAPEVVIGLLRDKYLNRMVGRKLSCWKCLSKRSSMMVFNYHTKASLALHCYWKHRSEQKNGRNSFSHKYNLHLYQKQKKKNHIKKRLRTK